MGWLVPPEGAPVGNSHDLTFYSRQLAEGSPDGKPSPYNYAVGHLGHEVGHRWSAYVSAKINGKTISLGQWPHWAPGLQTRVAFPYSLPTEASTMGGGVWQDNFDGSFTQLRDPEGSLSRLSSRVASIIWRTVPPIW